MSRNIQGLATFHQRTSIQNSINQIQSNCMNYFRNSLTSDGLGYSNHRYSVSLQQSLRNSLNASRRQKISVKLDNKKEQKAALFSSNLKQTLDNLQKKLAKAKGQLKRYKTIISDNDSIDRIQQKEQKDQNMLYQSLATTTSGCSKRQLENNKQNKNKFDELNHFSPKLKNYYICHLEEAIRGNNSRAFQHLRMSMKVLRYYLNIKSPSFIDIQSRKINLPKRKEDFGKKTLVINIDKTLIHCQDKQNESYDFVIPIQVSSGVTSKIYVKIRPYAISFLKRMSKLFQIIAFTAGHQAYVDAILNQMDPNHQYITHRLYRKNCILIYQNLYAKDLRIINRDLSSMVMVDNAPYSYIFQPENGIPILPYYSGEDKELPHLQKYLQEFVHAKDVREVNKKIFKLHLYYHFKEPKQLVKQLYIKDY